MNRETAERCTILRGLVGSTVHGLNVDDGIEDRDEMGICVEPLEEAMALTDPFEQFIYRSAAEREGRALFTPEDQRASCDELVTRAEGLEHELSVSAVRSPLAETPDHDKVQEWVLSAYRRRWHLGSTSGTA
jgi:hypothetical protein